MTRRWSHRLLCWLLLLTAVPAAYAQITHYEYWFDSDFSSHQTVTWIGDENGGINIGIPTDSIVSGLHRFNIRVLMADGSYSPITSQSFLKVRSGGDSKLEYWLDNDSIINSVTMAPGDSLFRLSLTDVSFGLHVLNTRALLNGLYSPVSSSLIFRALGTDGPTRVEYWFDGDYENVSHMEFSPQDSIIPLLLPTDDKFRNRLHTVQTRILSGGVYSPVYSSMLFATASSGDTKLEYWLDNDSIINSVTMAPGDSLFRLSLSDVLYGLHVLNTRVLLNGLYTPASSSLIFRALGTDGPTRLEYWFDGDYENVSHMEFSPQDSIIPLSLPTDDKFRNRLHTVQTRILSGGVYSPVYSSMVFATAGGGDTKLEYWYDDNFGMRSELSVDNRDSIVLVSSTLDLAADSTITMGMHRLNMRLSVNGNPSPVSTQWVLNGMVGHDMQMEYWLDSDFEHRGTLQPSVSGRVVAFADELNLSHATPGIHMMHYRVTDKTGTISGPADSTQVLVLASYKGDVNQDGTIDIGDVPALVSFIFGREKPTYSFSEADQNEDGRIQVNDLVMLVNVILDYHLGDADLVAPRLASVRHSDGIVSLGIDNPQMFTGVQFDMHLTDGQQPSRIIPGDASHSYLCRMIDGNTVRVVVYSVNSATFRNESAVTIALGGDVTGDVTISNIRMADVNATTVPSESMTLSDVTAVRDIYSDGTSGSDDVFTISGIRLTNDCTPIHGSDIPVIYIRNGRKTL